MYCQSYTGNTRAWRGRQSAVTRYRCVHKGPSLILEADGYKARVRDMFDRRVDAYDASDTFHLELATRLLGLADPAGQRVLDLCTGTGMVALQAAASARQVVGVDIAGAMVHRAAEKAAALGLSNCRFLEIDPEREAGASGLLVDASFDVVTCSSGMLYFMDIPALIGRVYHWLSPGGCFVFNTPQQPCVPATLVFYRLLAREFGVELLDASEPLKDAAVVHRVMTTAGFADVQITTSSEVLLHAEATPVSYAESLWKTMTTRNAFQPLGSVLTTADLERVKDEFVSEVQLAAEKWVCEDGIRCPYTMMWVLAKRP